MNEARGKMRPIHYARSASMLELLLDCGAEVDAEDSSGCTALSNAGNVDAVRLLLKRGANVNHQNVRGATALMFAVILDNRDVAKVLVEEGGADVTLEDVDGKNAMRFAEDLKRPEILEFLRTRK